MARLRVHIKWPLLRTDAPFSVDDLSAFASWWVIGNVLWVILGTTTFVLTALYLVDTCGRAWVYLEDLRGVKAESPADLLRWMAGTVLSAGMGVHVTFKGAVLPRFEDGMLRFRDVELESAGSWFSAKIAELDVSLSFKKWYSGHGLITDLSIFGMQARLRQHAPRARLLDPDYELEHIRIRDSRLEICREASAKPTQISIFNCDLPRLRGNKFLMDFFNANIVAGTVNNSMFSVHKNQARSGENSVKFELKGVDLGYLATDASKFNWLVAGKADVSAEIRMPDLSHSDSLSESISSFLYNCVVEVGENKRDERPAEENGLIKGAIVSLYETFQNERRTENSEYVMVNANVRFSDLQACMPNQLPSTSSGVPYVTLQGLRSLVTYINELQTPLTIKTYGIEKAADLDNLSSLSQTKIFECIVGDIYDEMLQRVKVDERRFMEEKAVHWSHTLIGQLFLIGLGVMA